MTGEVPSRRGPAESDSVGPTDARDPVVDDLAHLLARYATLRRTIAWDPSFAAPDLHQAAALVCAQQPVDAADGLVTQAALDRLLVRARARGIRVAPALDLVADEHGLRAIAREPITAGEPLIEVPSAARLRCGDLVARHPTLGPWLSGDPLFGPGNLMLWVLIERHAPATDPDGLEAAYVAALPSEIPGTALSWPRSPGAHLLAAELGQRFLAGVLQLYCLVHRRLSLTPSERRPLPLAALTLQRWLWAGAVVSTRQVELGGEPTLVPVWDLLPAEVGVATSADLVGDDRLRCVAGVDLTAGDEIGVHARSRTPAERWVQAGVVPPGPPDGELASLGFPVPTSAPLRRDKLVWVLHERDRPVAVPVGRGQLDAALERARWYALDAAELERLGLSSVADAWGVPLRLSDTGEARARALLDAWLRERAGPATPEQPFSREHALLLAAAHARYASLLPAPDGLRLLDDGDAPLVDEWLAAQPSAPPQLSSNLHAAGLVFSGIRHSGTWVGAFGPSALTAVATHARNGFLLVHGAPAVAAARFALTCSGRPLTGLVGARAAVDELLAEVGPHQPARLDSRYWVLALELAALPEELASPDLRASLRRSDDGETWTVELDGATVATASVRAGVHGVVEVSDVATSPAQRGRGFARWCVGSALLTARRGGARRATLLVEAGNVAARASYAGLGFVDVGDRAIVVLTSEPG